MIITRDKQGQIVVQTYAEYLETATPEEQEALIEYLNQLQDEKE